MYIFDVNSMTRKPSPKVIAHDLRILRGPPDSITMRSGVVTIKPGQSVGLHTTASNEELIVVLQGAGTATIAGRDPFNFDTKSAVYIPPQTEHDIKNTGSTILKYIYVVAKAE